MQEDVMAVDALELRKYLAKQRAKLVKLSDFNLMLWDGTAQDKFLGEYWLARMLRDESERIYDIAKANMLRDNLTGLEISTNTKNVKPGEAKRVGMSSLFECILGVQNGGTKLDVNALMQALFARDMSTDAVAEIIAAATVGTTPPKTYIVRPLHEPEQEEGETYE
jgi:hypothetical protein